ncbi:DoxX family protein [uncultured Shimia sp.]|uniref:DoxX family protein n=1 Tax=uncultured Shimia sp. TaxID=573152 RepID=UPI002633C593|nr:DoxX family protein [uncultured Shimia sp.]
MNALISLHNSVLSRLERADWIIPTLARFLFAAVLLFYFWNSGLTKLGDGFLGLFQPSTGAYVQIFPRVFEAAGYDTSQLSLFHWAVALGGTWAEFILPLMIVLGLLSRLAAVGMIGFIVLQSLTDIVGHHADASTIGAWFDRIENSAIMDQRALWVFLMAVIVVKGAGPLSLDRLLSKRSASKV